jgi:hypothetical protein
VDGNPSSAKNTSSSQELIARQERTPETNEIKKSKPLISGTNHLERPLQPLSESETKRIEHIVRATVPRERSLDSSTKKHKATRHQKGQVDKTDEEDGASKAAMHHSDEVEDEDEEELEIIDVKSFDEVCGVCYSGDPAGLLSSVFLFVSVSASASASASASVCKSKSDLPPQITRE